MATELEAGDRTALLASLRRMELIGPSDEPLIEPLVGGISSLIVRVETRLGPVCVKRALPKLKVAANWFAPVERNRAEVAWIRTVERIAGRAVPRVVGDDPEGGAFAMRYLEPLEFPVWKTLLRDGIIRVETARAVAILLVAIHNATADDPVIAREFGNEKNFYDLRLAPYLGATAERHPDRRAALLGLLETTAKTRRVLIHGDVSPKNILVGAEGPVFLDAEVATFGDPAFDVAFCLNHLLLKCVWRPHWRSRYLECFDAFATNYFDRVRWESAAALEERAAHLLAGLLLARIDGKSPVEYVTDETDRECVRVFARSLLQQPESRLPALGRRWIKEFYR